MRQSAVLHHHTGDYGAARERRVRAGDGHGAEGGRAAHLCRAGTAAYSAFSIYVQYHAKAEILFDVPADCFVPRPKVDSAVLKLVPLDKPAVETKDEKLFFSLVRAAFNMRRKTLVNALGPVLGSSMSKDEITALVEAAGLDARVRGERLSLAEYAKLADLAAEKLSN